MLGALTSLKKGHISTGSCCRLIKASRLCGGERRCVPLRWLFVGPGWRGADFPRRSGWQDKTLVTIFLTVCCCPTNLGKICKNDTREWWCQTSVNEKPMPICGPELCSRRYHGMDQTDFCLLQLWCFNTCKWRKNLRVGIHEFDTLDWL